MTTFGLLIALAGGGLILTNLLTVRSIDIMISFLYSAKLNADDFIGTPGYLWVVDLSYIILLIGIAALATGTLIACIFTGHKEDGKVVLKGFDRWIPEVHVLLGATAASVGAIVFADLNDVLVTMCAKGLAVKLFTPEQRAGFARMNNWSPMQGGIPEWFVWLLLIAAYIICSLIFAFCVLAIVKKIKARTLLKDMVIGKLFAMGLSGIRRSDKIFAVVMGILLIGTILSATWIGTIIVIILICLFVPKMIYQYTDIKDGVDEIRRGNLNHKIPVTSDGELGRFAESINGISESYSEAVANELKAQRLRTDLISNVSHDIKTPLTSMISYVDLLKKEGLDNPNAPEYLRIIDEKTQRLKKLTDDLFEAAKASSGSISMNVSPIDMCAITNQALGEMDDRLAAAGLNVIFEKKCSRAMVMADGALLWRVIENLLVNASKYALANSRVYVSIFDENDMVSLEIKNISQAQLNIDSDELMERFTRGDNSRSVEGSGLGLSIARDLTQNMGGVFSVTIDGDLFKAKVSMKKADCTEEEEK